VGKFSGSDDTGELQSTIATIGVMAAAVRPACGRGCLVRQYPRRWAAM